MKFSLVMRMATPYVYHIPHHLLRDSLPGQHPHPLVCLKWPSWGISKAMLEAQGWKEVGRGWGGEERLVES